MKTGILHKYIIIAIAFTMASCAKDFLDVEPKNILPPDDLFSSDEGIESHMASMYDKLPIEDFRFDYREGFNFGGN